MVLYFMIFLVLTNLQLSSLKNIKINKYYCTKKVGKFLIKQTVKYSVKYTVVNLFVTANKNKNNTQDYFKG